ncbi:O-Antigen ligase [Rhizobiales bacterium GAS188]|nr:O-Antigen ligase [Rhizobiales bacterium GAS188]
MIEGMLLAFGLVLSTTTQLRIGGAGIGPGEICLVLFVVARLCGEAFRLGPRVTPVVFRLFAFWTLFSIAQCVGTLTGYVIGDRHDPELFRHDVIAYLLLAAVSLLSVVEPGAGPRLHQTAWFIAVIGAVTLTLQLGNAFGLIDVSGVDPWYWDRLRGWSENPNQLAIFCAVHALVSLHLAEVAAGPWARIGAILCASVAVVAGRLSQSDTFSLVLVTAVPIFVAFKLRAWLPSPERKLSLRTASALIATLALPVLLISAVPLGYALAVQAEGFAKDMSKENGKAADREAQLRFQLWNQAIERGLESGMLGLGPGPHLEIPSVIVAARMSEDGPKHIEHPQNNSMPNFEAHSTLLDLFTQGGLIAVLSFIWLTASTFMATYRVQLCALSTLLLGLATFAVFHLIVRQPLFWFAISLCLVAGADMRAASPVRERSS